MRELVIATTGVLSLCSAAALAILPPPQYGRHACQHIGGRPVITSTATSAPAPSRCDLQAHRKD